MGLSSSGAAAFTMAWFHPELYHRVLAYSPTMVNQQWPHDPSLRGGAWEYHSAWTGPAGRQPHRQAGVHRHDHDRCAPGAPLIPNSPTKPIRFWFETGDQDLFYPATRCPTACTTGFWPTSVSRRCWPTRATTTSSCSPATPSMSIADRRSNAAGGARMAVARLSGAVAGRSSAPVRPNNSRPASRLCACR